MGWGLALSGGGAKGAAHVGAMKALEEADLKPSMVSGASAGAIVAGFYASGMDIQALTDAMEYVQSRGNYWIDPNYWGVLKAGASLIFGKEITLGGLIKGNRLERFFAKQTSGCMLRDACLPVCISAVDINTPRLVLFASQEIPGQGEDVEVLTHPAICEAIRASIAIPVTFEPLLAEGMRMVDGGVWETMPVSALYSMGASHVVAINVGYSGESRPKVDNLFEIASQSIDIMGFELAQCRSRHADIRIDVPTEGIGVFSFEKLDQAMRAGYDAMRKALPEVKKALSSRAKPHRAPRARQAPAPRDRTRAG